VIGVYHLGSDKATQLAEDNPLHFEPFTPTDQDQLHVASERSAPENAPQSERDAAFIDLLSAHRAHHADDGGHTPDTQQRLHDAVDRALADPKIAAFLNRLFEPIVDFLAEETESTVPSHPLVLWPLARNGAATVYAVREQTSDENLAVFSLANVEGKFARRNHVLRMPTDLEARVMYVRKLASFVNAASGTESDKTPAHVLQDADARVYLHGALCLKTPRVFSFSKTQDAEAVAASYESALDPEDLGVMIGRMTLTAKVNGRPIAMRVTSPFDPVTPNSLSIQWPSDGVPWSHGVVDWALRQQWGHHVPNGMESTLVHFLAENAREDTLAGNPPLPRLVVPRGVGRRVGEKVATL